MLSVEPGDHLEDDDARETRHVDVLVSARDLHRRRVFERKVEPDGAELALTVAERHRARGDDLGRAWENVDNVIGVIAPSLALLGMRFQ